MLRSPGLFLLAACAAPALGQGQRIAVAQSESRPAGERVRGITISTHGIGREWASARVMRPTFEKVRGTGAEWVALHPYGRIHADGRVTWRSRRDRDGAPPYWSAPIRIAHAAGLKVFVKPHLAYWGSPFSWRGEIAFETRGQWRRFFADYATWITTVATACRDADGFAVGTELGKTLGHEKEWRDLIARVRALTCVPLTYAANWTTYRRVRFWDALDVIGIQAYFPLTAQADPSRRDLDVAWERLMRELRTYADAKRRNIVFTELGYNRSVRAARAPWDHRTDGQEAASLQRRCLAAALAAVEREQSVLGVFLWKWFPEPRPVGRDFQLATPELIEVIERQWKARH